MNYYPVSAKNVSRFVVDTPGYGRMGVNKDAGKRLKSMLAKYIRESSRLCKTFLLVDLQFGFVDDDLDFLQQLDGRKVGLSLVFCRADRLPAEHWTSRAIAMSHQVRSYHAWIDPVFHIVSSR